MKPLPGELQIIATLIGREHAITLGYLYGGRNLNVPANPHARHVLTKLIGLEAAQVMAQEYGGFEVKLPTLESMALDKRDQVMRDMWRDGSTVREIALAFHLSERRVESIIRTVRQAVVLTQSQLQLFTAAPVASLSEVATGGSGPPPGGGVRVGKPTPPGSSK